MLRKEFSFLLIYFVVTTALCAEKRLLDTLQNNSSSHLESIVSKLQTTLQETQKKLSDLEKKVANSAEHKVMFSACHNQGAILGSSQIVVYNRVITNVGHAYNANDGEFRAPYAGHYSFSYTGTADTETQIYLNLVKNGAYIGQIFSNSGYADSSTETLNLDLQANDAVWVKNGGAAGSKLHNGDYNCFSGMLVHES